MFDTVSFPVELLNSKIMLSNLEDTSYNKASNLLNQVESMLSNFICHVNKNLTLIELIHKVFTDTNIIISNKFNLYKVNCQSYNI